MVTATIYDFNMILSQRKKPQKWCNFKKEPRVAKSKGLYVQGILGLL